MNTFEVAICWSVISLGFIGKAPQFLNLESTFNAVSECSQASATREAKLLPVLTLPRYLVQALKKFDLNDLKMPTLKSYRMCVVCDGRHSIWPLLSCASSITSIKMWTMAIHDQQYRSGRGDSAEKRIELLQKKICVDPPFSLFTNSVFAMAPSLNFSGSDCLRGYTITGGKTYM